MNDLINPFGTEPLIIDDPAITELIEIRRALDRHDDDALDAAAAAAPDRRMFYERLRHQSGHVQYSFGRKAPHPVRMRATMQMTPVITRWPEPWPIKHRLKDIEAAMVQAQRAICGWIGRDRHILRLLSQPVPYTDVCHWSATDLQKIVLSIAQLRGAFPARQGSERLYGFGPGVPTLRMIVGAIQSPFGDPPDYLGGVSFRDALAEELLAALHAGIHGAADAAGDTRHAPWEGRTHVRMPDAPGEALLDGVCAWIEVLAEDVGIEDWDVQWVADGAASLSLRLREIEQPAAIVLRAHQLGLDGIERVVATCHRRAGASTAMPSVLRH